MAQTDSLHPQEQEEDTLKGKYLIFSVGNDVYGMEIRYVIEIIGIQPITKVPDMPEYVTGVINLRGKIIPVMDARLRFKKEVREYDNRTCIIVLDTDDITVGLIADSVSEVLDMGDGDVEPLPEVKRGGHEYIMGIGKAGGSIKLLLDCKKLLTDYGEEELGALA